MRSFQILDNKDFMRKLLIEEVFDTFLLSEASITTFATFSIDGTFRPDYLNTDEAEQLTAEKAGYALWRRIRPFFFELTKGRHTPLKFRIVLRLADHNVRALLTQSGLLILPEQVGGLFFNIAFDGKSIVCTSGTSLKVFSLDKSLEQAWDGMVEKFLRQRRIPFT